MTAPFPTLHASTLNGLAQDVPALNALAPDAPALVGISHGTSSAVGQQVVAALVAEVAARRPELAVRLGHVDVQQPDVPATLASLAPAARAVVVPLLLSAGYHVHVDLRRAIDDRSVIADALGPDPRLAAVLARRLAEAGLRADDTVVLGVAGSSDPRAVEDCHRMAELLALHLGRPVQIGFLSAAEPRLAQAVTDARCSAPAAAGGSSARAGLSSAREAVWSRAAQPRARVIVASYLLAPGYFHDLARAAGADVTTEPLLTLTEPAPADLVDIVIDRYAAAAATVAAPAPAAAATALIGAAAPAPAGTPAPALVGALATAAVAAAATSSRLSIPRESAAA